MTDSVFFWIGIQMLGKTGARRARTGGRDESVIIADSFPNCNKEALAALRARRLGVSDSDLGKEGLENFGDFILGREGFEEECSAAAEVVFAEICDELGEVGGAVLVGVGDSGEIGSEVGKDKVGGFAEGGGDLTLDFLFGEVALNKDGAGNGLDGEEVGGDDMSVGFCELGCDLRPSAGGGAEVGDDVAGADEFVGLVDLEEFESGAGAVSLISRGADKRVVLLPLAPLGGLGFCATGHFS